MQNINTYPVYNCYIIDKDPVSVSMLSNYLKSMGIFEISGVYLKIEQALHLLNGKNTIDFLFVGIDNDNLSGFDLAIKLRHSSRFIIFMSEDPEYALNAFQSGGDQYLMKPLIFRKFSAKVDQLLAKDIQKDTFKFMLNPDGNSLRIPRLFK